jgi:hypothetical protein
VTIIPVNKKGHIKVCENYRGINLLNSGYKIYSNIINNKFYTYYKNQLSEEENEFKKGLYCRDDNFSLKILVKRHKSLISKPI